MSGYKPRIRLRPFLKVRATGEVIQWSASVTWQSGDLHEIGCALGLGASTWLAMTNAWANLQAQIRGRKEFDRTLQALTDERKQRPQRRRRAKNVLPRG